MKKFSLLFLCFPLFLSAQLSNRIAKIDSALDYLFQRQLFNGTVLIGEKGKVLYKKSFGVANLENKPLTAQSAFNLASLSKQFFAMMVMILQEQGKLDFDNRVVKFLPSFPYPDITLRQLLNHESGLPEYFDLAEHHLTLLDTLTNSKLLDLLVTVKPALNAEPGSKWAYCNTNYAMLALIIEKASGMQCTRFFQEYITGPLKMHNTYIYDITMNGYPLSRVFGFHYAGGRQLMDDLGRFDGVIGDGNIYSTAEDLYKWDQALYAGKLVRLTTFQQAIVSGKLNDGKETGYGFGWFVDKSSGNLSHTGSWAGFRNLIVRYLTTGQTLIILDNSGNTLARSLLRDIIEGKDYHLPETQLIKNVKLVDGTGTTPRLGSVRILEGRIADMGDLRPFTGEPVIDGRGRVLSPGFIDNHSHHERGLEEDPNGIAATNQGITTIVIGQDGESDPVDSLKTWIRLHPVAVNIASYTGHATLREMVMGKSLARTATNTEIESMKKSLATEIEKGSLGLSSGLEYEEGFYANTDEVLQLARQAAMSGGRYISHIRSEDIHLEEAIEELLYIGREAKIPVQISHIKIAMRSKWGNAAGIIARLEQARAEGIDVTADCYPYTMWSATPRVLFPKKDFDNLKSAEYATRELFDPAASVMTSFAQKKEYEGKTISSIAAIYNETPAQALMRVIREGGGNIAGASMQEGDIDDFLKWGQTSICSDGANGGHPRGYGAFTRVLGRYIREKKLMPLETAIYKMTGLTAEHLGLRDRGLIRPGYFADLVLFDPETVADHADFKNPIALSSGIEIVWVNGKIVYQNQKATGARPGLFISRTE